MNPKTVQTLRDLRKVFERRGNEFFVLGGGVTDAILPVLKDGRIAPLSGNGGIDLAFPAVTWSHFYDLVESMNGVGFRESEREELLIHSSGTELFLWPFGSRVSPRQRLTWPGTGREYSTVGLAFAMTEARPVPIAEHLAVPVPPIPMVLFLKIVFYLSRMTGRDLIEIVKVLRAGCGDSEPGPDPGKDNAFSMGTRIRKSFPESYLKIIRNFLVEVDAVHAPMISQLFRGWKGMDPFLGNRMEDIFGLFLSFQRGLDTK